jgi:hypothetical protein
LILTLLEGTYNNIAGSDGDIDQQILQITTDLNNQDADLITMNAAQQTAYLTDYSKLQQILKRSPPVVMTGRAIPWTMSQRQRTGPQMGS